MNIKYVVMDRKYLKFLNVSYILVKGFYRGLKIVVLELSIFRFSLLFLISAFLALKAWVSSVYFVTIFFTLGCFFLIRFGCFSKSVGRLNLARPAPLFRNGLGFRSVTGGGEVGSSPLSISVF